MVAVALALLLSATPSARTAGSTAEGARFRQHVTAGERLYAAGDFGGAAWHFRRADEIRLTPEVAFNLAKAHERLGDAALAAYYYRVYLHRAPDASDSLAVAETLADLLSRAEANGRGLLEVEAEEQGTLSIDGRNYPELPVAVFLAPGDYRLEWSARGKTVERTVSLLTGKTTSVAFQLSDLTPPDSVPAPELSSLPPPPLGSAEVVTSASSPPPPARALLHKASWVLLGASAAALAGGTALGAMSRSAASRAQDRGELRVSEAQDLAASANTRAKSANALWISGGLGALAGGVVFAFTLPEPGRRGGER